MVAGLDEEEVECEDRGNGRGERRDLAVARGNEEDREQVDDAEPRDGATPSRSATVPVAAPMAATASSDTSGSSRRRPFRAMDQV